ncbi:MAG TPA: transglycosylase SLT domain-containing protein [Paludibacteraceae bacterium]|nr:transglycosylase SLT domain-containing protein [Paludibacteraceae bacterium]HOU67339.1 transglycosylase SLT domain-containing protein [Paludibacteraceae bacterium]HPH62154.1 transglycosylase SLT domain-containing protein [Paludibacteraceae bacterium]HQF49837.1 transglycosylase SLT domain-containing protein [Paludibacteraceae bacterium]
MKRISILFWILLSFFSSLYAKNDVVKDASSLDEEYANMPASPSAMVSAEVVPNEFGANLDSLLHVYKLNAYNTSDCVSDSLGFSLDDSTYMRRLQQIPAIMELSFNDIVKRYIEVYTIKKRKQVSYMLGAGKYYFPIFEKALDAAGLPIELKYLPVIESALNPRAFSRAGASGLWQFMYATGKIYGLEGNSLVDERRDPIKATDAAVRYLSDLYGIYNDWALVIAAYNCGPGNVNKAIRRSGGKRDYWAIYPFLPIETRGYVPAFIAATYTMTYCKEHKFCPAPIEMPISCDTLMLNERIHLLQISEVLGIGMQELESLNPQYRRQIIPGNGKPYTLCLPQKYVNAFIDLKDSIINYKNDSLNANRVTVVPAYLDSYYGRSRHGRHYVKGGAGTHVVRRGDTLSTIARKYGTSVKKIQKLNGMRSTRLRAGQRLRVK